MFGFSKPTTEATTRRQSLMERFFGKSPRAAVKRPWQTNPYDEHQVRVFSATKTLLGAWRNADSKVPQPTTQGIQLADGTTYVVFTDGSFRNVDLNRRPAVLSGRQRVRGRKQLRRLRRQHALHLAHKQAGEAASSGN